MVSIERISMALEFEGAHITDLVVRIDNVKRTFIYFGQKVTLLRQLPKFADNNWVTPLDTLPYLIT